MTDLATGGGVEAMVALPPGLHPRDQQGPEYHPGQAQNDAQAFKRAGTAPFSVENSQAVGVNQRSAKQWSVQAFTVTSAQGSLEIAGGMEKGRVSLTLYVPNTYSQGVIFAENRSKVDVGVGGLLNPGDSITINSEASCWIAVIPGQTTGQVIAVDAFNPPIVEPE